MSATDYGNLHILGQATDVFGKIRRFSLIKMFSFLNAYGILSLMFSEVVFLLFQ
jgi:hypothetical protein